MTISLRVLQLIFVLCVPFCTLVRSAEVQKPTLSIEESKTEIPVSRTGGWDGALVGFGVDNMIAQAFYDSGRFRLVEAHSPLSVVHAETPRPDWKANGAVTGVKVVGGSNFFGYEVVFQVAVRINMLSSRGESFSVEGKGYHRQREAGSRGLARGNVKIAPHTVRPATENAIKAAVGSALKRLSPVQQVVSRQVTAPIARSPLFLVRPVIVDRQVQKLFPAIKESRFNLVWRSGDATRHNTGGAAWPVGSVTPIVARHPVPLAASADPAVWLVQAAPGAQRAAPPTVLIYGEVINFALGNRFSGGIGAKIRSEVRVGVQLRAINLNSKSLEYVVATGAGDVGGAWMSFTKKPVTTQAHVDSAIAEAVSDACRKLWPQITTDHSDMNDVIAQLLPRVGGEQAAL